MFPIPEGGNFEAKSVKFMFFLKKSSSQFPGVDHTKYIGMMNKDRSSKTVNFMTPEAEVPVLRRRVAIHVI